MLLSCSSSQSGVPGAATAVSAGNLLEMHILSLCPRPADGNSGGETHKSVLASPPGDSSACDN